jgi:cullin 4
MDRAYLLQTKRLSIQDMGISIFRDVIVDDRQLQKKIIDGICDLITSHRIGQLYTQALSKDAISLFHDLAVYTTVIEPELLKLAQDFIMKWADDTVKNTSLADYVRSSVELMDSELKRCEDLELDLSTRRDLLALLEHQLVQRQQSKLCKFRDHVSRR